MAVVRISGPPRRDGDDILVAGWLTFADPLAAIRNIMAEWTSDHDLLARAASLAGANDGSYPAGLNDGVFLKIGETVQDSDGARDFLTGSSR